MTLSTKLEICHVYCMQYQNNGQKMAVLVVVFTQQQDDYESNQSNAKPPVLK